MEEATDGVKRLCVRFNDKQGCETKFYKTRLPDESTKKLRYLCVKYAEQLARGAPPTFVAMKEKFEIFKLLPEDMKTLPESYQSSSPKKKQESVKKFVDELVDELAAATSHGQGVDTREDYPDDMQVGEGSTRQFDMTVREGVDMQLNNIGQIQVDEVLAAAPNPDLDNPLSNDASLQNPDWGNPSSNDASLQNPDWGNPLSNDASLQNPDWGNPLSNDASLQNPDLGKTLSNDASLENVAWNQCDKPLPVPVDNLVYFFNDLKHRASMFPGRVPKFEWSEEAFRSFVIQLEFLEGAALEDDLKHSILQ